MSDEIRDPYLYNSFTHHHLMGSDINASNSTRGNNTTTNFPFYQQELIDPSFNFLSFIANPNINSSSSDQVVCPTKCIGELGDQLTPSSLVSSYSSDDREDTNHQKNNISKEKLGPSSAQGGDDHVDDDVDKLENKVNTIPKKKGEKRQRQPRFAFMTKSEIDNLEDGYRWRKYGQKAVKNSPFPRSYYRCTSPKCTVKKRVERSNEDPTMVITTYEGQHDHHSPSTLRGNISGLTLSPYPVLLGPRDSNFPIDFLTQMLPRDHDQQFHPSPNNYNPHAYSTPHDHQQQQQQLQLRDYASFYGISPYSFAKHEP